ncbi:ATP-binding protein [Streptomyces sp. TRM64462]|uniref:AAA family ATPase n=1 Tax=Streptomyces sp. TRM64462 TaxID=2741726 RepID=UPI001585F248|nr:ArsR family transcriptional regulator [Streptomyces sp. TRM64462]
MTGYAATRTVTKPEAVFDRDEAWDALTRFTRDPAPGPRLGVVSGRLRQGKTYLLEALAESVDGGFLFCADDAVEAESLRRLGEELARHTGGAQGPQRPPPRDWGEALDALLALGARRPEPVPVVLDEFPRLVAQSPALAAALLAAFRRYADVTERAGGSGGPGGPGGTGGSGGTGGTGGGRARLLLSGSSHPVMRRLFCGPSPLKALVALDLEVRPFGFREAARFWGIDDHRLALRVHAVVGGTPAYRRAFVGGRVPEGPDDFDAWVCGTALDPRTPLFHEAPRLVHEEADRGDRALCHSVLAAVALGASTPGEVAGRVGASLGDVSHALALLQDCELLRAEPDALRPHLTRLRVAEPLLAFDHAVVRPYRTLLERDADGGRGGVAAEVWSRARETFESTVARADFAEVCRAWVREHATPDTFGAVPGQVGYGSLAGPGEPGAEVVVRGQEQVPGDGRPGPLLSVGLARWGEVMDVHHLEWLRRLTGLLAERGEDVGRTVLVCYSSAGFGPALRAAETEGAVTLVGADRLYRGG